MSAAEKIIEEVEAEGAILDTDGERIILKAERPIAPSLLEQLKAHKSAVVESLTRRWIKRYDATNPHLRHITRSVTRPEAFECLTQEWRETWQAIVYGLMVDGGWNRTEAEREAWRLVRQ